MSRPYETSSEYGNQRRNKHGDKAESSQSGSSRFDHEVLARGGGQVRPPWLKGKDIGHYYRDRGNVERSQRQISGNKAENSQSGSSEYEGHARGERPGRPPWLKGKEIGLYYRDRALHKQRQTSVIRLPRNIQHNIERVLDNSKGFYDKLYKNVAHTDNSDSILEKRYSHIYDSQFKRKFLNIVCGNIQENIEKAVLGKTGLERNSCLDEELLQEYERKSLSAEYANMLNFRLKLPAYQKRLEVLELIRNNQVVVISGETGCGKTTQVVQLILDDQILQRNGSITRIMCTQPRRISAISVAERVAAERAEKLGVSVGFQIRLERIMPRERGSITFCTNGMLLKYMERDPALNNISHVILDEIHERTTESDFTIALLKLIITKRPDLKVLLMSATLNPESFSKYYNDCPMIHIPGFTYPVIELYLEDVLESTRFRFNNYIEKSKEARTKADDVSSLYIQNAVAYEKYPEYVTEQLKNANSEKLSLELIEKLIKYICNTKPPGAILVFLPGIKDITYLHKMLTGVEYPRNEYVIYPLHSRMPTVDQKNIFKEPPEGVRKIIIATNIAEASITIEDVVYVIDSGKMKTLKFDLSENVETLKPEWVSLANSKQRRGRAGRVKSGICYHLYTRARERTFEQFPLPEMLTTRLETIILQIKTLQLGKASSFLSSVMDPPHPKAIDLSLKLLTSLNALDCEENLTPLGYHLAQLPVDPRTGKMIIWAALFSCVEPVFAIAASLSFKNAFYCPLEKEDEANRKKFELGINQYSDHIALAEALRRFEYFYRKRNASNFCKEYFLSFNTLKLLSEMKTQFTQYLYEMKFLETDNPRDKNANRNSDNIQLVKAIVCAGLYPNVATVRLAMKHGVILYTSEDNRVDIHPSSINHKIYHCPGRYITYFTKQRSSSTYLLDTTFVTVPILLFAAGNQQITKGNKLHYINLTSTEKIACSLQTARLIQSLQNEFNNLLEYKVTHPGTVAWNGYEGELLNAIIDLACQEDVKNSEKYIISNKFLNPL
ncbi:ATP-dependent DNA/RNA helicase DHX36 isoform X1 [Megalopta genalis]|uniref:ATP-dependent DNA/RNA helicase DHX36 isoform X1 n=1 Tax=Megalopta genalis TaxID=115081 RepID=UPI003FCF5B8A